MPIPAAAVPCKALPCHPATSEAPKPIPIPPAPTTPVLGESGKTPRLTLLTPAEFAHTCKLENLPVFHLETVTPEVTGQSASTTPDPGSLYSIPEQYHDFANVFSKVKASVLADHRLYDLKITLEDGTAPPLGPVYSLSQEELKALHKFIDENVAMGFITPSRSSHGAPVLFIKKKDSSLRLCVDFRGINRITKKDRYPLPLISDLLNAPHKACIYTKINLWHAYHLVRIATRDEWKTVFRTRYGSFEWKVMPEGLTNTPAGFQCFMNDIFADMIDISVVVYLDDILVYSDDTAQHVAHVREVLRRLRKNELYARADKCEFHTTSCEYLRYMLSLSGLGMAQNKIQAIQDWPEPRKVRDVQSFLSFVNFYRRFIYGYSMITVPLTRLTKKDVPWDWSDECRTSFNTLKKAFTTAPVLTHWIPDMPIMIETDASDYALAAVMSIRTQDGDFHPVTYLSKTFDEAEKNYDVHDKELTAINAAFRHWRHYLEGSGTPIDIVTDHCNLQYFSTTKVLMRRQAWVLEFLSQFNLVICFRPGKLSTKPDTLTRRWDVYPKEGSSDYARINPQNLRPVFTNDQLASSLRTTVLQGPVLHSTLIMDAEQLHNNIRADLQSDPTALEHLSSTANPHWVTSPDGLLRCDDRIYVPDSRNLHLRVLQYSHDHLLSGHFGQTKTLYKVWRHYMWPGLPEFIKNYCKSCTTCSRAKPQRHRPYGLLKQLPVPERPWNSISMDFIEQLPLSSGYTSILVIVDRLSKQSLFIPTHDTITSHDLAQLFVLHVFSKHGVPSHVTSDRGSEFVSHFFRSLGTALNMKLHFMSGYHPEGDGQTERTNQTLEQYLQVYCNYQQDNWSSLLPLAEFAYNNTPSSTMGVTPFFTNKGYHPNLTVHPECDLTSARAREFITDLDELHTELRTHMADAQKRYQGTVDSRRLPAPAFTIGSKAFVKAKFFRMTQPSKKLADKFLGPYEVIAQPGTQELVGQLLGWPSHTEKLS